MTDPFEKAAGNALVSTRPGSIAAIGCIPQSVVVAGEAAQFAWDEFFQGTVRNRNTRIAYLRAIKRFLAWTETQEPKLARITPGMVGRYFDELPVSVPSKKLHLAAIRAFFDVLVRRHVVVLNPALSVRTERYSVIEGRTPEITVEQSRRLLAAIRLETVADYRDRALIAALIYTGAGREQWPVFVFVTSCKMGRSSCCDSLKKAGKLGRSRCDTICRASSTIMPSLLVWRASRKSRHCSGRSAG